MYDARELTVEQIGQVLGVSRTTIYRALGSKAFAAAAAAEAAPSLAAPTPTPTPASTLTPVPVGHATKPVAPAAALKGSGVAAGQGQRGGTTHGQFGSIDGEPQHLSDRVFHASRTGWRAASGSRWAWAAAGSPTGPHLGQLTLTTTLPTA